MTPAGLFVRRSVYVSLALLLLGFGLAAGVLGAGVATPALAAPAAAAQESAAPGVESRLTLSVSRLLSLPGQAIRVTIEGPAPLLALPSGEEEEPRLVAVHLYGPLTLEQVGRPQSSLPDPLLVETVLEPDPQNSSLGGALRPGTGRASVVIPAEALSELGAYAAAVMLGDAGQERAEGMVWFGRVPVERTPLDLAFVWPLAQGIHRDADGVFFDDGLEALLLANVGTAAGQAEAGSVWALSSFAAEFPRWRFTLAIEPILLTQLGEMASGYSSLSASGEVRQVPAEEAGPREAARLLHELRGLATRDGVDVAVAPYAGPSPAVLASRGWNDGTGQVRLAKQVVQQVLGGGVPAGGYSPDLDLCTRSISTFSRASIDHLVVDAAIAVDLLEPLERGRVTARVRDTDNERLTLVLADGTLRSLLSAPWDPGLMCAALAAQSVSPGVEALVLTPLSAAAQPPLSYLQSLARATSAVGWMRTVTLSELVRSHPPGSRPVFLDRSCPEISSYVALSLLERVGRARESVETLAAAADPSAPPVEGSRLLLYTAESRWWSLSPVSPGLAGTGLQYAVRAEALAEAELTKIVLAGAEGTTFVGRTGTVELRVENRAQYPLKAQLDLRGSGMILPQGATLGVELLPGMTVVPVEVGEGSGPQLLAVDLVVGGRVLDTWSGRLRFLTVMTFLPWVAGAVAVIVLAVGVPLALRDRARSGRKARPQTGSSSSRTPRR